MKTKAFCNYAQSSFLSSQINSLVDNFFYNSLFNEQIQIRLHLSNKSLSATNLRGTKDENKSNPTICKKSKV
ncbi:MAG: hypothetical protein WC274_08270 [Sulfurimonas sp.]